MEVHGSGFDTGFFIGEGKTKNPSCEPCWDVEVHVCSPGHFKNI